MKLIARLADGSVASFEAEPNPVFSYKDHIRAVRETLVRETGKEPMVVLVLVSSKPVLKQV